MSSMAWTSAMLLLSFVSLAVLVLVLLFRKLVYPKSPTNDKQTSNDDKVQVLSKQQNYSERIVNDYGFIKFPYSSKTLQNNSAVASVPDRSKHPSPGNRGHFSTNNHQVSFEDQNPYGVLEENTEEVSDETPSISY